MWRLSGPQGAVQLFVQWNGRWGYPRSSFRGRVKKNTYSFSVFFFAREFAVFQCSCLSPPTRITEVVSYPRGPVSNTSSTSTSTNVETFHPRTRWAQQIKICSSLFSFFPQKVCRANKTQSKEGNKMIKKGGFSSFRRVVLPNVIREKCREFETMKEHVSVFLKPRL